MLQREEQRWICYDNDLEIEAYTLRGIVQKFPNHFHECYVVGYMVAGRRHLWCKGREYDLTSGDLVLFNPWDNHFCAPASEESLDYFAFNIRRGPMMKALREIFGEEIEPNFIQNVIFQSDTAQLLNELYHAIVQNASAQDKKTAFHSLLKQVLRESPSVRACVLSHEPDGPIKSLCAYMEAHFADNITLDDLIAMTNFGKSYLIRSFTKQIGVSPYRYLQTVRVNRAKQFLEQGIPPVETAIMAGFSDQSHLTNYFKEFSGLTPKQYQRIFIDAMVHAIPENQEGR